MGSLPERLDGVPLKMLQADSETALKLVQEGRRQHAATLWRAAQLAKFDSDKELGAALGGVEANQLSAWKSGTENPQTWRWEQHPRLGPALLEAQAEKYARHRPDEVDVETTIRIRRLA